MQAATAWLMGKASQWEKPEVKGSRVRSQAVVPCEGERDVVSLIISQRSFEATTLIFRKARRAHQGSKGKRVVRKKWMGNRILVGAKIFKIVAFEYAWGRKSEIDLTSSCRTEFRQMLPAALPCAQYAIRQALGQRAPGHRCSWRPRVCGTGLCQW
jgi:hypothetical protein